MRHLAPVTLALRPTALALALAFVAPPPGARAQDVPELRCDGVDDFPCAYQLDVLRLHKVPATLKVQARVAQSKLPIGEGLFTIVYVKLLRGGEALCQERFDDVRVVDSVINLELGRNMDCELDEVIADDGELAFQLCPGAPDNCLQPIALGATAYAIKTSFASVAAQAHTANSAGQAHYAHRATADRDLAQRPTLATGYFDFATPTAAEASALYPDPAAFAPYADAGFVAWTPTRSRGALDVHVAGKRHAAGELVELAALTLAADATTATGDLVVTPSAGGRGLVVTGRGAHVTGASDVDGALAVSRRLTVASEGLHVTGDSAVAGALVVAGPLGVASGGLHVTGDSDVAGALTVSQRLDVVAGNAVVGGDSDVAGTLLVHGAATVAGGGLTVAGDLAVGGALATTDALTIAARGLVVAAGGLTLGAGDLTVTSGGATITGDSRFGGRVTASELELEGSFRAADASGTSHRAFAMQGMTLVVDPDKTLAETVVHGPVHFSGPVVFDGGAIDPRQPETFVHAAGEARDLVLGGALTVLDALTAAGGLVGGLQVTGGATVLGALVVPDGIGGDVAVQGGLQVTGAATFAGPVAMPAGVVGDLTVGGPLAAGALELAGAALVSGVASFPGGVAGPVTFADGLTVLASGALAVAGPTTLAGLTVGGAATFSGAARFEAPVVMAAGVDGATAFGNNLTVVGATLLGGATHVASSLTVDGDTRFNGPVDFGGAFAGTTQFQNVTASGTLGVGGLTIFAGKVAFPGGISGSVALGNVQVATGLGVTGAATFSGPVDFRGEVLGLDDLPEYVKVAGETRDVALPSLAVSGGATLLGTLTLAQPVDDLAVESLRVGGGAAALFGATSVKDDAAIDGAIAVAGAFAAPKCRLCLNYGDTHGAAADDRKYACAKLQHGSNSGLMQLYGDVNSDDVFGLKLVCDGGPSGNGVDEWR